VSEPLKVALLGCGTVGGAVLRLLSEQSDDLAARVGRRIEVAGVAVRRPDRHPDVPAELLTTDAMALVNRPDVDLVVEVIGGIEPARSLLLAAMAAGKSVVSANKTLLADDGVALHAAAADGGVDLYYEAAVAGAIPLLRPLRESLAGDQLRRVVGIVNGTTNYILSRMAETGAGFGEALAEATELGYAEADPTADVDGFDAAAKAAILASLAFHGHRRRRVPRGHLRGLGHRRRPGRRDRLHGQAAGDLRAGDRGRGRRRRGGRARAPGDDPDHAPAGRGRRGVQRRLRRGRGRR
jgi:homoserine dehydrogenase